MAFENLVSEVAGKYGLGPNAGALVNEVVHLVTGGQGGLGGFVDRLRSAGLGSLATSWLGQADAAPMTVQAVEQALGSTTLNNVASRLGLSTSAVAPAVGYVLPRVVGLMTPGGTVPATIPVHAAVAPVQAPVQAPLHPLDHPSVVQTVRPTVAVAPQRVEPLAVHVVQDHPSGLAKWIIPAALGLGALGLFSMLAPSRVVERPVTPPAPVVVTTPPPAPVVVPQPAPVVVPPPAPVVVTTPPPAPVVAPPTVVTTPTVVPTPAPIAAALRDSFLSLTYDNGVLGFSGVVRDEATRNNLLEALRAQYGADKIRGSIAVDPRVGVAPWLTNFRGVLDNLRVPGVQTVFSGNSLGVGGLSDADRDRAISGIRQLLGDNVTISPLTEKAAELIAGTNGAAIASLSSLATGYSPRDLMAVLNSAVVNFPTGSADVPGITIGFLKEAAARIRQLPGGTTVEIAGYTDNSGDPMANVALSQQRAEAIRQVLVNAGVAPSVLTAKGFGSANPIAGNDTVEGRFRNRRIEFSVVP
jgi:OOP family OmpA-OmpF porin